MITIKVFDFDNTIYRGESSIDFALYMLRYNKRILLFLPDLLWNLISYKFCIVSREKLERRINDAIKVIVRDREELLRLSRSFWLRHSHKLDEHILRLIDEDDLIITAGPFFLIDAIKHRLNTRNLICSEVDWERREVSYFNFGDNKVKRYRELCGEKKIDRFYTDSFNDKAMMDIAERVFIVRNGNIKCIK